MSGTPSTMRPPRARWPRVVYGEAVVDQETGAWPVAGQQLLDELARGRNRFALIASDTTVRADELINRLAVDLTLDVVRLGPRLADKSDPPTVTDIELVCGGSTVITDLDVLMWPDLHVPALQLLSTLARRQPTIGVWPGVVAGNRATYSSPGRPDHQDVVLRGAIVLRPRATRFPDEVPYTLERILP